MTKGKKHIKIIRISTVPLSLAVFFKGFLRRLSKDYEVVAVSSPGDLLELVEEREKVRTIAVPMERHISIFKDFISLCRLIITFYKEKPTIVHSITPKAGLLSMIAAWITRVPIRIHTFTGLVFPTATGLKRKILILMDKLTCACATYVNPESIGVKNDLESFHITQKPLHIIANGNVRGVDMNYYKRTEEVLSRANELKNKDSVTFCFIGRLVGDKGINELVQAFDKLTIEYKDIRLFLVGPEENELDPLSTATLTMIKENKQITCFGEQKDVRPFLAASDIFVFPSYREGMPNVVLEAGAMGLPSIVTDINGSNEIIVDGVNGEIIPVKDTKSLYEKMKNWINNPYKVKEMAKHAHEMIENRYEQQMIWDAVLTEYKKLLTV